MGEKNRRTMFATVDPLCLMHPTTPTFTLFMVHEQYRPRQYRQLAMVWPMIQRLAMPVNRRFEIDEAGVRRNVLERQNLRAEIAADAVLAVDPVKQVAEPRPH